MTTHHKVALLGATGKAGKYILQQLLTEGYAVKALIRKPEAFTLTHSLLEVITGDAKDPYLIHTLIKDCTAVISAIGQTPGEPLVASLASQNIINAMNSHGVKQYIFLSGLNLDVTGDQKSEANQAKSVWMRDNFPEAVGDKQKAYELAANSTIDWTMVRLPWINVTDDKYQLIINLHDCPGEVISTTDLAEFVVSVLTDNSYLMKAPFVASL